MNSKGNNVYINTTSGQSLLHIVSLHLVNLREKIISSICVPKNTRQTSAVDNHDIPACHTMVSHERHNQVTAVDLAEL